MRGYFHAFDSWRVPLTRRYAPTSPRKRGEVRKKRPGSLPAFRFSPSCPGFSRASTSCFEARKSWMAGSSPAMTMLTKLTSPPPASAGLPATT